MSKINSILLSVFLLLTIAACNNDEPATEGPSLPEYSINILSPVSDLVSSGETIELHVDFEEANELTIHNVNVEIETSDGVLIYEGPSESHVQTEGRYELFEEIELGELGVGTQLIITAKVWGHTAGFAEQMTTMILTVQ